LNFQSLLQFFSFSWGYYLSASPLGKVAQNKAACVINLSSIQKAVRGYQNMNQLTTGGTLAVATLTSAGFWQSAPVCPAGGTYSPLGSVPSQGIAYMTCNVSGHAPSVTILANW